MRSFQHYPKSLILAIGLLLAIIVQVTDLLTGPEVSFSIFYLLIAAYLAWFLNFWVGIVASVLFGIISVTTDYYSGFHYSHPAIPFWEATIRATIFSVIVVILCRLKDREEKLKSINQELSQKNRELDQFTTIASHDLQAPLATIKMLCQILENKQTIKGINEKEYLTQVKEAIERMLQLIRNLLSYAKITKTPSLHESINLKKLITDLTKDLDALIKEKNAQIELKNLPTVKADPIQMRQLFQNLIANALKYSKKEEPPCVEITSDIKERFIEIYVKDNGIGFQQKDVEKIFMPFQRLQNHTEGTGIGLPICKKIVEQHNGEITATSTPNQGSTFIVRLPISS